MKTRKIEGIVMTQTLMTEDLLFHLTYLCFCGHPTLHKETSTGQKIKSVKHAAIEASSIANAFVFLSLHRLSWDQIYSLDDLY